MNSNKTGKAFIAVFAVMGLLFAGVMIEKKHRANTVPVPNQSYEIMMYVCEGPEGREMFDVNFVGQDRDMKPQLVYRELTKKVGELTRRRFRVTVIPPGTGMWAWDTYPEVDGLDYGRVLEFYYNGELQPLSGPMKKCGEEQEEPTPPSVPPSGGIR